MELLLLSLSLLAVNLPNAASYVGTKVHNYQTIETGEQKKGSFSMNTLIDVHLRIVTCAKNT